MKKKLIYLLTISAFYLPSLSSCHSGVTDEIQQANSNKNLSAGKIASGGCGALSKPVSIIIEDAQTITKGSSKGLSAYVQCKNGKELDITSSSTWSSSDYNVLDVDNKNYKGKITGVEVGNATLKVTYDGLATSKQISVVNSYCGKSAQMVGMHVEPFELKSIPIGGEAELHLYADCNNDTHPEITNYATWQTSSKMTVDVNNDTHKGLITGKQKGSANISATIDNKKVYDHKFTVDSALLKDIIIDGSTTVANGLTLQLRVTGVYADGDNIDITKLAKYSVVYGGVAVDNAGKVTASREGDFKIQVSLDGKFGYFEGHVTSAELLGFTLNNPSITFTPYLNTSATITAKAQYSDGKVVDIPSSQLQCEMQGGEQTNIIQNSVGGCTFSQLGESNSSVKVKVTYSGDLELDAKYATLNVSLAQLKSIQLQAKTGNFVVGDRIPYAVKLNLSDGRIVDVTNDLLLTLKNNSGVTQSFAPTTPILFDSKAKEIIFNKAIIQVAPYKLVAKLGNLESSITYSDVKVNTTTPQELNDLLVQVFKDNILKQVKAGNWYALHYDGTNSVRNDDITRFFTGLASSSSSLSIGTLYDERYKKTANIYNKAIDYDTNDPAYKISVRLQRNPANRSSEVIISEFCNNTPVVQSFSSASLSTSTTEGFSWGLSEQLGVSIATKIGVEIPEVAKGEVTTTQSWSFSSNQNWSKSETRSISLGGATVSLPPRKHAVVISTLHNTDFYYDGKLPLKLNGEFPVLFELSDEINHVRGIGVVNLAYIFTPGKNAKLDKLFELSNGKLYLDLSPQLVSSGGKDNKTITHSIYFVDDNATGQLPCIYPNGFQNGKHLKHANLGNLYQSNDLSELKNEQKFEFLNRKPDEIIIQN